MEAVASCPSGCGWSVGLDGPSHVVFEGQSADCGASTGIDDGLVTAAVGDLHKSMVAEVCGAGSSLSSQGLPAA